MNQNHWIKRFFLASLALAALSGCRYSVNLITERRSFDRYLDMIRQAQSELGSKTSFYNEAIEACEDDSAEPYPRLNGDLQGMAQSIKAMKEDQARIEKFKASYDAFAAGRAQINSDATDDWARFKALQSEFSALSQPMNQDIQGFRQQAQDFAAMLSQFHVEKISTADLNAEIQDFMGKMRDGLGRMDQRLGEDRKVLEFARNSGVDGELVHRKEEIFKKMRDIFPGLRLFKDTLEMSAGQLAGALQGEAVVWTGPGMPGTVGKTLADFRASRDEFWKNQGYFDDLARKFDEAKVEPREEAPRDPAK